MRKLLFCFCLVLIGFLCYQNTFRGEFVFDDRITVVDNPLIKTLDIQKVYHANPKRFLPNLTFSINYKIGGKDVFSYHLFNFFIHIATALSVFWFVTLLSKRDYFFSAAAAIFFTVHPIVTQAVSYISQRYTSMAALFYILSLSFYIKSQKEFEKKGSKFFLANLLFYLTLSLVFLLCAFLSKESAFTLPVAIVLVEYTFFSRSIKKLLKKIWLLLPVILISLIFFATFFSISIGKSINISLPSATHGLSISPFNYFLTQLRVIVTYIRLLFLPINQNLDYDYPIFKTFWEPTVMFSFLFLAFTISLAVILIRKNRLLAFSILFFFLTLLPESSIIPIADVINEHRLYLPSVGFAIFLTTLLFYFPRFIKLSKRVSTVLIALIIIFFSFATYRRNFVWQSQFTLWSDVVVKSPNKARGHYSLGVAYKDQNQLEQAVFEFKKAIELDSEYEPAYNNLGVVYEKKGELALAQKYYRQAVVLNPTDFLARNNLAQLMVMQNNLDEAQKEYENILKIDVGSFSAHNELGIIYLKKKDQKEAIFHLQKAIELNPDYVNAYYNLGTIYFSKGENELAREMFRKVLTLVPENKDAKNYLEKLAL